MPADPQLGPGERLHAVRFPVVDLASDGATLRSSGITTAPITTSQGLALVLDPTATLGARFEVVQA